MFKYKCVLAIELISIDYFQSVRRLSPTNSRKFVFVFSSQNHWLAHGLKIPKHILFFKYRVPLFQHEVTSSPLRTRWRSKEFSAFWFEHVRSRLITFPNFIFHLYNTQKVIKFPIYANKLVYTYHVSIVPVLNFTWLFDHSAKFSTI